MEVLVEIGGAVLQQGRFRIAAGEIHQAPDSVGLFTDVVVFLLEFDEVFCGEGDGLGAGEVEAFALQEVRDFAAELVCEFGFGFDTYFIEIGDWVAHFGALDVCKYRAGGVYEVRFS